MVGLVRLHLALGQLDLGQTAVEVDRNGGSPLHGSTILARNPAGTSTRGTRSGRTAEPYRGMTSSRRSPAGLENRTSSSVRRSSSTSVAPCRRRNSIIRSTNHSGAEAPLVTPTTPAPASHSALTSVSSSTRYAGVPASLATSARRLEFEEFTEPMTSTTSACCASALTASCRFCVA